jgi:8-oxo-dGTP pyrophosphatase MutT (NUDIX family)
MTIISKKNNELLQQENSNKFSMTFTQKISLIKAELQKPLPGTNQQYLMAPEFRRSFSLSSPVKNAGVMICIFPGENDLQTVFIKRRDYDGPHGGQVSLPGGVYEVQDQDMGDTAIRETREEIGIDLDKNEILGSLTPLLIPISAMQVHPFVCFYRKKPVFTPENREVEYLIIAGLGELSDPKRIERERWMLHGSENKVPFYRVQGNIIWGATAMIISEFLAVISGSGLYPQSLYSDNYRIDT